MAALACCCSRGGKAAKGGDWAKRDSGVCLFPRVLCHARIGLCAARIRSFFLAKEIVSCLARKSV